MRPKRYKKCPPPKKPWWVDFFNMCALLNERRRYWLILFFPIIGFTASIILVSSAIFLSCSSSGPMDSTEYPVSYQIIQEEIKLGDEKYRNRAYHDALSYYGEADDRLSALIDFEKKSPQPDLELCQVYYNSSITLLVKLQLAAIGWDLAVVRKMRGNP
jgi:hypothetical protein